MHQSGPSKWLDKFDDLDVRYFDGRMEYAVRNAAFPGVTVRLVVLVNEQGRAEFVQAVSGAGELAEAATDGRPCP